MPASAVSPTKARDRQILTAGFASVALRIQEAATTDQLSNGDVCRRLSDALQDAARAKGTWCYYIDHFGDDQSGDVIYASGGDTMKAPYSISQVGDKQACNVDVDAALDVVPRTIYEEEVQDEDHYTAMEAAKLYKSATEFPLYERFISKEERSNAPSGSFAGKGKSFPILKPSDVMAAVRSMGRAGSENHSTATLKANIIRIAKAKGWTKELPKAWQGDGGKESAARAADSPTALTLKESAAFGVDMTLREAFGDSKRIKLIGVGKGATAWYTAEALKKAAADGIFRAGTPMRIDHPTAVEESQRPEGSVKDWGAVLGSDAQWLESFVHPKSGKDLGPGLYSDVKPFSDHAQTIQEKGPYAGVSIAAHGDPLRENGKIVMRDGVPVLERFTSADGVDMVTRAGAGGMFLSEAAHTANPTEGGADDMDAAQLQKLQESIAAQTATNGRLMERAIRGDAREAAVLILKGTTLVEAAKDRVIEAATSDFGKIPLNAAGELDVVKFTEAVNAAAKTEGAYIAQITGAGKVRGMGPAPVVEIDAKEADRQKATARALKEAAVKNFQTMGMPLEAARAAAGWTKEVA